MADENSAPKKEDVEEKGDLGGINSPEVDENTGKPKNKAVSSYKQAYSISKGLFDKATSQDGGRIFVAAQIAEKYGGGPPYRNADLRASGQDWRNNFGTNFLGSIVDRAKPQITDPIRQSKYITFSQLPERFPDAAKKTAKFRERTTKLIRAWTAWDDFVDQVYQENYLYGNAAPSFLDDDWRPAMYRFDEIFLPSGSGQHASQLQLFMVRKSILLHDFLKKIEDKQVAIDAGYDWDGCIKAANEGVGHKEQLTALQEQDIIREGGVLGMSYSDDTKLIWLYHLIVREYDGGVDIWTTTNNGTPVRHVKGLHEKMEDSTTLFTLQTGNTKFYGSRGAGRMLANIHIAIERVRNLGYDQLYLSGLPILQCELANLNRIMPQVRHPFIMIDKSMTVVKEGIQFNYEGYERMDKNLSDIAEAIAGAFIPPKLSNEGSPNTKIEAAQKAERELAVRNGVLGRAFRHLADLVGCMQRKIYKPENLKEAARIYEECKEKEKRGIRVIAARVMKWLKDAGGEKKRVEERSQSVIADKEAVDTIVDLMKDGLSQEEIVELALSSAGNAAEEQGEQLDMATLEFIQQKQLEGNPFFDQKEMAKMQAEIRIGEDRAKRIILAEKDDPNNAAVAAFKQITEFNNMIAGYDMPVASTDNHRIHRMVLVQTATPMMKVLETAPTPELVSAGQFVVKHLAAHLSMDMEATKEQKMKEEEGLQGWITVVENAMKVVEQQAAEAAKVGANGANALPPPVNGQQPLQANGSGQIPGDQGFIEAEKLRLEHRKVDVKERELQQQDEHHNVDMATRVMQDVANKAAEAHRQGLQDAEADLQTQTDQNPTS